VDTLSDVLGSTFVDKGFMSVTTEMAHALDYGAGGVVLELKVPPGVKAIAPQLATGAVSQTEYELLLQRGLRFYVSAITQEAGVTIVHATVVSPITKDDREAETAGPSPMSPSRRFVYEPGDLERIEP
jgi:hypothetical protein